MKIPHTDFIKLFMLFFVLFSFFSCSKDTDLLAEYVATDIQESRLISNIFIDDSYVINGNENIVLDVFSNDSIYNPDNVRIVKTSQPNYGEVVINENSSLTYAPSPSSSEEDTTDTFTYTTETEQNDGTVTSEETTVLVTKINDELKYWKRLFDDKWKESDRSDTYSMAKSANREGEYYFLSYYIDGLSSIWQATGNNSYLDILLDIVEITIDNAAPVGNGYLGWVSSDGKQYALWDSYYWRHVITVIRILHQSPTLRAGGYQAEYEALLAFSEKHIWERYEKDGLSNFYRSRTHMASHWARIGMELYIITGKIKYKEVFDNISHGEMFGYSSNLRNQLYPNPKNSSAYAWDSTWGVNYGNNIQDTSHAGAIVHFWVLAYENGMYWTKSDIDALVPVIDIVWEGSSPGSRDIKTNIDGSGGDVPYGRLHEWLPLARYDIALHQKVKKNYTGGHLKYFGCQPLGISALNAKILTDGKAVYPEN